MELYSICLFIYLSQIHLTSFKHDFFHGRGHYFVPSSLPFPSGKKNLNTALPPFSLLHSIYKYPIKKEEEEEKLLGNNFLILSYGYEFQNIINHNKSTTDASI